MATGYVAFPDRREGDANCDEATDITSGGYTEDSPDDVIQRLLLIDWRHPALLVYRSDGDDRWSYMTLGLSSREWLGEGDG